MWPQPIRGTSREPLSRRSSGFCIGCAGHVAGGENVGIVHMLHRVLVYLDPAFLGLLGIA